jgi:hypothetical protein
MAKRSPVTVARSEWLRALRDLALDCADGAEEDTGDCVCEMNELLLAAPEAALLDGVQPMAAERLVLMLEAGAHDSVVLTMLGRGAGYLLSRNGDGHSLASIALPGLAREKSAAGANPALALVGALALSLASAAASARLASTRGRVAAAAVLH